MSPRRPKKASQLATALIEHSSDAITLVDEAGTVLYANPPTGRMLGLPISDCIGANVFRWVHDDDMLTFKENFGKQLDRPGIPVRSAFRLRHSDLTWRRVETIGVNRLDDPGIRGIIINYRDVTERHLAQAALQRSEGRFRRLIEEASDMIYNCDVNGHFTFLNQTAVRIMKYSQEELIGRHFLTLIRPDFREPAAAFYDRQWKEAIPSTYFEFPAVAKDGTIVWVGQNVQIQHDGGKPIGVQAIARDITARLALEDQLRQAQKMEAIGRLASGVAHDFNNVLTAILGSADLLSVQLDEKDPRWEEADAIKRAADRGAALTRRLLAFSRPQRAAATSVDLVAVVHNMLPMLRRLVLEKIVIEVNGEGPIGVRAEESHLTQILMNLVVNARDAMPEGGAVTIDAERVELSPSTASSLAIQPGRYAKLTVTDTGQGIDSEVEKHLFEPFFTTKPPDQGSGLGLSIVYGIMKSLGGAIEVWSEPRKGAKFTIYLPLSDDAAVARAATDGRQDTG
ncbi:MAG TPA: PAS domain S-box protein [Vicinamibacterales bacterium]|jgi:PAS domain S-box-containing protein|nr:PAS domain S-box protein [Vicinamibacterales bacterium]